MKRVILILAALAFAGCSTLTQPTSVSAPAVAQSGVHFPPLPKWVPVSGTITTQQLYAEVARLAPSAQLLTSDATYTVLDHEFALGMVAWMADQLREKQRDGLFLYDPEGHDCDKFAKAFTYLCEMAAGQSRVKAQPLAARIFVRAQNAWGGVPGGGYGHAIVAIATTRGIIVCEPQSTQTGGCWCFLAQYPNREYIWRVTIGG